jgi:UDP-N-acetylmuramyl pentapeptide phosphotransferase/UDP-N-acetylglucosamine-1-phosphate transferase
MNQIIIFIVNGLLKDYFNPLALLIDYSVLKPELSSSSLFLYVFVFSLAFGVSQIIIPQSIRFANRFQLVDHPNSRKTHLKSTPILGGVSIFFGVVFTFGVTILSLYNQLELNLNYKLIFGLFSAISLMVFFGLKDDILQAQPIEKVIFQIITAFFVIVSCEVRIDNFGGLFGVYELSTFYSYIFSVFVFVILVNAFNLIDGIDGLSASIGLISTLSFGTFFFFNDLVVQALVMLCYSGALTSFLIFNFKKKLFLGDNGSMSLGVVVAFGVFSVITLTNDVSFVNETSLFTKNSIIVILALISFPLLDTIRVFFVRMFKGQSPFQPDRNHLHHHLTRLKFSHFKSTLFIVTYTILITLMAVYLSALDITKHFFIMLFFSSIIYLISITPKSINSNTTIS